MIAAKRSNLVKSAERETEDVRPQLAAKSRKPKGVDEPNEQDVARAQQILNIKIEYIFSDEFTQSKAISEFRKAVREADKLASESRIRTPKRPAGLPSYLASLYEVPLLRNEQELSYFRLMNFLKYQADQLRAKLSVDRPNVKTMDRIQAMLAEAAEYREKLIRANLRLVVANARRFVSSEHIFDDLVSDGNLALMHAVEKFDYARGFRFSTYATHAIRRTYYRRLSRKQSEKSRIMFSGGEILDETESPTESTDIGKEQLRIYNTVMKRIEDQLDDRELFIVLARYGLDNREEVPTLQSLAVRLGICKERVRQLQNRALVKMRNMAQDLHTGWELPVIAS